MNAPRHLPKHFGPPARDYFHPLVWDQDALREAMLRVPPAQDRPPMPVFNAYGGAFRVPNRERAAFNREVAWEFIDANPGATTGDIYRGTELGRNTIQNAVKTLVSRGRLRREPGGTSKFYTIGDQP